MMNGARQLMFNFFPSEFKYLRGHRQNVSAIVLRYETQNCGWSVKSVRIAEEDLLDRHVSEVGDKINLAIIGIICGVLIARITIGARGCIMHHNQRSFLDEPDLKWKDFRWKIVQFQQNFYKITTSRQWLKENSDPSDDTKRKLENLIEFINNFTIARRKNLNL